MTGHANVPGVAFVKAAKRKKPRVYRTPQPLAPLFDTHAHLTCFWDAQPAEVLVRAGCAGVRHLVTLFDPLSDDFDDAVAFHQQLDAWQDRARDLAPSMALLAEEAVTGEPADVADAADFALAAASVPHDAAGRLEGVREGLEELVDTLRYLVGVHPYGAPSYTDEVHAKLLAALEDPRCVGVGEIGLDYHFDAVDNIEAAPHDVQMSCMARQLELAVERDVPVELHLRNDGDDEAREAHADAYRVLKDVGIPSAGCVLHCFGEDRATMERFVELGCHIAYGGAATFKRNEHIREAFAATPLDRILFETDCPYMAPEPIRGLECEPAMIAFTADALARDRAARTGEDPAEVARAAWTNALRLFD